ncbi:PRC-barrel domain-containing protein [Alkalicella caledoniensis]|uniref:PRC-barrel domain-containing protein n=1 Tax=Alkalicella caledoniensis TaxID=2731377 RepID=A0A7G9W4N8_ALKCA|nr:PRC-barrel domain-containing protein [Alkalicella caledoniensis]QNO13650.1 PRC-barrel domain-containing protein [Alkalicella caledoniensis]
MLKTKDVIGLPVINLNDGKQIGKVKDILFDNISRKAVALEMAEKAGLFKKSESFLKMEQVHSIGKDAVTIEDLEQNNDTPTDLTDFKASTLIGRNILQENGSTIGKVGEINFSFPEGAMVSISINDAKNSLFGGEKGMVDLDKIRAIGKDAVIVYNQ